MTKSFHSEFWEKRKYLDSGSRLYIDHIVTCRLETVQYRSENDLQHPYVVTREFATDVCRLDLDLDNTTSADYFEFIDNWGTVMQICWLFQRFCFKALINNCFQQKHPNISFSSASKRLQLAIQQKQLKNFCVALWI